jgi:hypothetical protein
MNPNRITGPSIEIKEVHTRTTDVTLSREEAEAALAQAAIEKAGINPELNNASVSVCVYETAEDYDGFSEICFEATITEDLSGPAIPDEAPTDPQAFRLFGQPRSIIMASIVAECQPAGLNRSAASSRENIEAIEQMKRDQPDYWDGVVPRYPNNT